MQDADKHLKYYTASISQDGYKTGIPNHWVAERHRAVVCAEPGRTYLHTKKTVNRCNPAVRIQCKQ